MEAVDGHHSLFFCRGRAVGESRGGLSGFGGRRGRLPSALERLARCLGEPVRGKANRNYGACRLSGSGCGRALEREPGDRTDFHRNTVPACRPLRRGWVRSPRDFAASRSASSLSIPTSRTRWRPFRTSPACKNSFSRLQGRRQQGRGLPGGHADSRVFRSRWDRHRPLFGADRRPVRRGLRARQSEAARSRRGDCRHRGGTRVRVAATRPVGCRISRLNRRSPQGNVTYAGQISRILQAHCVECHRAGEAAPLALTSYAEAAAWAETIREVIDEGRMPPWREPGSRKVPQRRAAFRRRSTTRARLDR